MQRAVQLDPLHPSILNAAGTLEWARSDLASALTYSRQAADVSPGSFPAHNALAITLTELDRHVLAVESARRAREVSGPSTQRMFGIVPVQAAALILGGRQDEGRRLLREAERTGHRPFWIGSAYAALGESEEAFRRLRRTEWDLYAGWFVHVLPWLDPIRDDPRFRDVRGELYKAWGLGSDGSLPAELERLIRAGPGARPFVAWSRERWAETGRGLADL